MGIRTRLRAAQRGISVKFGSKPHGVMSLAVEDWDPQICRICGATRRSEAR